MKLNNLIEGLTIFKRYFDDDGYHTGAEHGTFYVNATHRPISDEDIDQLIALDWFQSCEETGHDGRGEFKREHYKPDAGWQAFGKLST